MKLFLRILVWIFAGAVVLSGAAVAALFLIDWNDLRDFAKKEISDASGREVEIHGNLDVRMGWSPTVVAEDVDVANPQWASRPKMAHIDRLEISFRLPSVLFGPLDIRMFRLNGFDLLLEKNGEKNNWRFGAAKAATPKKRTQFPVIRHLEVHDAKLAYRDTALQEPVQVGFETLTLIARDAHSPVDLKARGKYRTQPFSLDAALAPFGDLISDSEPYHAKIDGKIGDLVLNADAGIDRPLDFQGIDGTFELKGRSLSDLYDVAGLPMPKTGSFRLAGHLREHGEEWRLDDFRGRLGKSTLNGSFRMETGGQRPKIIAALDSTQLHFEDFEGFWASNNDSPATRSDDIFSRQPFSLPKLNRMDADVKFRGKAIQGGKLHLKTVAIHLNLDNGLLSLKPVDFGLEGGRVVADASLDARQAEPRMRLHLQVTKFDLNRLLTAFGVKTVNSAGELRGELQVAMHGQSPHALAASATGGGMVVMGGGHISDLLLQAAALDLQQAMGDLVQDKQVAVNCIALPMPITNGRIEANPWLFDTSNNLLYTKGFVDLGSEKVKLTLEVHPKDFSLFNSLSAITIEGDLAKRTANVNKLEVVGKLVLKTLAAPFMTFLSQSIEEKSRAESPCRALFRQIEDSGGTVSGAASGSKPGSPVKGDATPAGTAPAGKDRIVAVQRALRRAGFELAADGVLGPRTGAALRQFQGRHKLKQTGVPDPATVKALGLPPADSSTPAPAPNGG